MKITIPKKAAPGLLVFLAGMYILTAPARRLSAQTFETRFRNYGVTHGLMDEGVFDMIRDSLGFLWAYTTLGISRFDGSSCKNYLLPLKQWDNTLFSIDNRGVLWATNGLDLFRFDARTDQFLPERVPGSGENEDWLSFFHSSIPDGVWFRKGGSLYRIPPSGDKPEIVVSGLARQWRNFGFRSANGRFYFNVGKVQHMNPQHWQYFEIVDPNNGSIKIDSQLIHPASLRFYEDNNGTIWMGTWRQGLVCLEPEKRKVSQYFYESNPVMNTFYDMVQLPDTTDGSLLWIGANDGEGIFLFDPVRRVFAGRLRHDANDPNTLGSDQVIRLYRDHAGLLWAGHWKGLSLFDPSQRTESSKLVSFRTVITGFRVLGQSQVFDRDSVTWSPYLLKYFQNAVTFVFTAPDFSGANGLRFEYRLDGSHSNWTAAGESREATYLNLGGGSYTFRVRAVRVATGVVSEEAVMKIRVIPPFWATWWFRGLLVLAFIALVYAVFRYREVQRLQQEKLRLRIARDLHDEMGSTLSSISILSEAALRHLQADIDRARFGAIGDRARQVMEAMSDIVWSVNPRNDSMANVLQRMKQFAVEILEPQGIALHFEADEAVATLNLPMEQRKDFYLLFKEAVNNAAKYSGASDVWVSVQAENGGLTLEVRDNGRGFDVEQVKRGNGLWNMERRAERMGGRFSLESRVGEGTRVLVQV
ncbi:MAG: ATP-binding protein [Thermoanaerobaculia bacterium]|nr:ATP-binding protein [Thermoanaerobaculia bacterium]